MRGGSKSSDYAPDWFEVAQKKFLKKGDNSTFYLMSKHGPLHYKDLKYGYGADELDNAHSETE